MNDESYDGFMVYWNLCRACLLEVGHKQILTNRVSVKTDTTFGWKSRPTQFLDINRLQIRLHKPIHIQGIWKMFGMRWTHAPFNLPFIRFILFIGIYKQYGITLIPLQTSIVALFYPYSFSCIFHYIFINYKQSNALPSTVPLCE